MSERLSHFRDYRDQADAAHPALKPIAQDPPKKTTPRLIVENDELRDRLASWQVSAVLGWVIVFAIALRAALDLLFSWLK